MPTRHALIADVLRLLAILTVAISLVPVGAHVAEMPSKMALAPADYMTVQRVYGGWALFGIAIYAALISTLLHAWLMWGSPLCRLLSLAASLCIAAGQAVFWLYTQPINALTRNWTVDPPDLSSARQQWELSHAVNALLTATALVLIISAVIAGARDRATP